MLSDSERCELEFLRQSASKWILDPCEKAFFNLDKMIERAKSNRVDAILSQNSFHALADAIKELKRKIDEITIQNNDK